MRDGAETQGGAEIRETLGEIARTALKETLPEKFLARTCVEVRYFGRGERWRVRRNGGSVEVVLYIHKEQNGSFHRSVLEAGAAALKIFEHRTTIRTETLENLWTHGADALSREERREVLRALSRT